MAINSIEKALGGVGESIDPTLEKQEIQIEIENPEKVSIERMKSLTLILLRI